MKGETNLKALLRNMSPILNAGQYVFVTMQDVTQIPRGLAICEFQEKEGVTLVIERSKAEELGLAFEFVASWITLQVNSALEAVGLTAKFSNALAQNSISCNVFAGFHHDHIFVDVQDASRAINVLRQLSEQTDESMS